MATLIYSPLVSLDGYLVDAEGRFDWAAPDVEVHSFINQRMRPIGTHLYGRRLYETLKVWDKEQPPGAHPVAREYAEIWQPADKIVYSRTLEAVDTAHTRLERDFDPEAVRKLVASTDRDLLIGGADLASHAFKAGLIDEVHLYLSQILVGGGRRALPDGVRLELSLLEEHRFTDGTVFVRYKRR